MGRERGEMGGERGEMGGLLGCCFGEGGVNSKSFMRGLEEMHGRTCWQLESVRLFMTAAHPHPQPKALSPHQLPPPRIPSPTPRTLQKHENTPHPS